MFSVKVPSGAYIRGSNRAAELNGVCIQRCTVFNFFTVPFDLLLKRRIAGGIGRDLLLVNNCGVHDLATFEVTNRQGTCGTDRNQRIDLAIYLVFARQGDESNIFADGKSVFQVVACAFSGCILDAVRDNSSGITHASNSFITVVAFDEQRTRDTRVVKDVINDFAIKFFHKIHVNSPI